LERAYLGIKKITTFAVIMNRINTPILTEEQRKELEEGFKNGKSRCFRIRCQVILLKAECRSSKEVGALTGMCEGIVNSLTKKYKTGGINALQTKPGQGRKPIITEKDKDTILAVLETNRQLKTAKAEWEKQSGKKVCANTFKSFLKKLKDDAVKTPLK
jgi:transposase